MVVRAGARVTYNLIILEYFRVTIEKNFKPTTQLSGDVYTMN